MSSHCPRISLSLTHNQKEGRILVPFAPKKASHYVHYVHTHTHTHTTRDRPTICELEEKGKGKGKKKKTPTHLQVSVVFSRLTSEPSALYTALLNYTWGPCPGSSIDLETFHQTVLDTADLSPISTSSQGRTPGLLFFHLVNLSKIGPPSLSLSLSSPILIHHPTSSLTLHTSKPTLRTTAHALRSRWSTPTSYTTLRYAVPHYCTSQPGRSLPQGSSSSACPPVLI